MTSTTDYPALYIIVRTDMPSMTIGKAMAHSGHAANAFVFENYINPFINDQPVNYAVTQWISETKQGFGTQINLKANWDDAQTTLTAVQSAGLICNYVTDPTYPYEVNSEIFKLLDNSLHVNDPVKLANGNYMCFRREITAIYFFGMKSQLQPFLKDFPLHP
jgi:hypothetical protein